MLFNMYINSFSLLPTCVFPRIFKVLLIFRYNPEKGSVESATPVMATKWRIFWPFL